LLSCFNDESDWLLDGYLDVKMAMAEQDDLEITLNIESQADK
jgi:hypothetical protein